MSDKLPLRKKKACSLCVRFPLQVVGGGGGGDGRSVGTSSPVRAVRGPPARGLHQVPAPVLSARRQRRGQCRRSGPSWHSAAGFCTKFEILAVFGGQGMVHQYIKPFSRGARLCGWYPSAPRCCLGSVNFLDRLVRMELAIGSTILPIIKWFFASRPRMYVRTYVT